MPAPASTPSTGLAPAYTSLGLAYTAVVLAASLALQRAPPGYTPQVTIHTRQKINTEEI